MCLWRFHLDISQLTWVLQHSCIDEPETLAGIYAGPVDGDQVLGTVVKLIQGEIGIRQQLGTLIPTVPRQVNVVQGRRDSHTSAGHRNEQPAPEVGDPHGDIVVRNVGGIAVIATHTTVYGEWGVAGR